VYNEGLLWRIQVSRRGRKLLGVGGAVAALSLGLSWLWWQGLIEVPAAIVQNAGRVAGVMSVRGTATVALPIDFHRQEHSLSCEVATLKMALSNFGDDVSEAELIANLPFDTTPKGGGVWGDPHIGFVGDIDGQMFGDGYGVYWEPIARLGLRYRRTEVLEGASAAQVAGHIAAGRPVITWGYFGRGRTGSWLTPTGRQINAIDGEHTRVVIGFSGSVGDPTSFKVIDPITGPATWSKDKFMNNWSGFGWSGVVIYAQPRWVRAAGDGKVWEISKDGKTRHWVKTWSAFVNSGGYKEAIRVIDKQELGRYKQGSDITS